MEEVVHKANGKSKKISLSEHGVKDSRPVLLQEIQLGTTSRFATPDNELNRVLGGGIISGSLTLLGGQPGIGKSTLLLQLALSLDLKVLYISGEESEEQIRMRADRVGLTNQQCYILSETNTERIFTQYKNLLPQLIIIDSIQTLSSSQLDATAGTISQIRECAAQMQRLAKETGVPVFLIGHITKDGSIAGPKLLEHIVDTVLQFEGDQHYSYRILRTIKNRFGSTSEIGIYEMRSEGLRPVDNPSELLISQKEEGLSGSAISATVEGHRPILIEVQALVSPSHYGTPQRSTTGFDLRRLNMLLAVLEKRAGLRFGMHDVFLNIAGGIRIDDPAIDMAIISALISSLQDIAIPSNFCFAGEIGLSGEIRAVNRIEQRIQEANRLGFEQIFISKYSMKGLNPGNFNIALSPVSKVDELFNHLFG